jgi:hypothetical protein
MLGKAREEEARTIAKKPQGRLRKVIIFETCLEEEDKVLLRRQSSVGAAQYSHMLISNFCASNLGSSPG